MAKTKKQWQKLCKENKVKYTEDDTVMYLAKSLASALGVKVSDKDSVYKLDGKITEALANQKATPKPKEKAPEPTPEPTPEPVVEPTPEPEATGDPLESALGEYLGNNPNNIISERQLMFMGVSTYNINMPNVNLRAGKYLVTRDRNKYHMFVIHTV